MQYRYNLHAKPCKIVLYSSLNILNIIFELFPSLSSAIVWVLISILIIKWQKTKNKINIYFTKFPISKLKWCLLPPPLCTLFWTLCTCVRIKTPDYGFGCNQTNDVQQRRLRVFNQSGLLNLLYYDVQIYWTIGLHF